MATEPQATFDFELPRREERFDGATYEPVRDRERLTAQLDRVRKVMESGKKVTLTYLARVCDCSEASVSARLRDLRKKRFGGFTIERTYKEKGVFEYQMRKPE